MRKSIFLFLIVLMSYPLTDYALNSPTFSCSYLLIPTGSDIEPLCAFGDIQFAYDPTNDTVAISSLAGNSYSVNYQVNGYFYSQKVCGSSNTNGCVVTGTYPDTINNNFPYFSYTGGEFYFNAGDSYSKPSSPTLAVNMDFQNISFTLAQVEPIGTSTYDVISGVYSAKRVGDQNDGYAILFILKEQTTSE